MSIKRIVIYVVAGVIVFLMMLTNYYKWDGDLARQRCAALEQQMDDMEMEWRRVIDERNNLGVSNGTLTAELNQWRTRPPETVEVVRTNTKWRTVPADCRACIEQYELDKSYTNPPVANVPAETIRIDIKDVLGADVAVVRGRGGRVSGVRVSVRNTARNATKWLTTRVSCGGRHWLRCGRSDG